jgi:hypothetical protein
MQSEILHTLDYSDKLIISPDVDGFTSAYLLSKNKDVTIVGTYDKNILTIADGIDIKDCLFVDCDMNHKDLVSIGNHMRLLDDNMSEHSFNPNVHYQVSSYPAKYPYATCYLIAHAMDLPTSNLDHAHMAFSDSTYKNMMNYYENMKNWSYRMPHASVDSVIKGQIDEYIAIVSKKYGNKQNFVSRRLGDVNYLSQMNNILEKSSLKTLPVTQITKYDKGLIDKVTLKRYMNDILSYAEIYTGEYSVTYVS